MPEEIRGRPDDLDLFEHPIALVQVPSPFAKGQTSAVNTDDEVAVRYGRRSVGHELTRTAGSRPTPGQRNCNSTSGLEGSTSRTAGKRMGSYCR